MSAPIVHFRGNSEYPKGSPTLREFLLSSADIDIVQGPVGSGKSLGSIMKAYKEMCLMPRSKDGVRRSRGLVVRQTYGELQETVIPDWLEWFPEETYGEFRHGEPSRHRMRFADVECDVIFMAMGDVSDAVLRKLRSSFFTWAWINEIQFLPLRLVTEIFDRTGRYPRKQDCPAFADRFGDKNAWGDMNAPFTHDHWVLYMRGDTPVPPDMPKDQAMMYAKPPNWRFHVQPPAVFEKIDEKGDLVGYELNPEAENLQNTGAGLYMSGLGGKPRDQIDRDYRNITRAQKSGALRYPMFSRERHVAPSTLRPDPEHPVILSADGGASPAAVFWQNIEGRWFGLHALVETNLTTSEFVPKIVEVLRERFPFVMRADGPGLIGWGDPALSWRAEQGSPSTMIYAKHGIEMGKPWAKDRPQTRLETGRRLLGEFPGGEPKVLLCPTWAQALVSAFENASMKTVKIAGTEQVREEIVKNRWSHPVEAAEYGWCGGGEARETLAVPNRRRAPIDTRGAGPQAGRRSWKTLRTA